MQNHSSLPRDDATVRSLTRQLAVGLIRRHADPVPGARRLQPQFDPRRRHDIAQHIAARLGEHLSVAEMATHANLSTEHFSRLFRNTFGCTPHRHLVEQRLQRVCELMDATARPLAEIAGDTGFADQSHLTRSFKARFGEPPNAWRLRHERSTAFQ
ncbi:MAG TPA: AraC family transcriptional regulator [Burkholderiaceae bacterium]|jgi:AraC family transcriptional regulator